MTSQITAPRVSAFAALALAAGVLTLGSPSVAADETPTPLVGPTSMITTTAGTGRQGFSGDGGPARSALINQPRDSAIGPGGSLYVADTYNNRIRRVDPDGIITTIAGTGSSTFGGDGGPATSASISLPHDVTVDTNGDIYIADSKHHRIRLIDPAGTITTVAGTGSSGFNGDNRLATSAKLKHPKSVAVFGGSLYIADGMNNRIRRVDLETRLITTIAGTGVAGFSGDGGPATHAAINVPQRIAFDSVGNLYFTDTLNNRIRRVDAATGVISTVAGTGNAAFSGDGGLAVNASLRHPRGIAVVNDDILYIADSENHRIREVDLDSGVITTIAGSGSRSYVGDGGPARLAGFKNPRGLTVDPAGNLIVADTFHNAIRTIWVTAAAP